VNGLDRPEPADELGGCENDLCWTLDMRSANELRRELSCPRSRLPAIGEISTAAVTATRAPRDRIVFLVNILLLLPWSPAVRRQRSTAGNQNGHLPRIFCFQGIRACRPARLEGSDPPYSIHCTRSFTNHFTGVRAFSSTLLRPKKSAR